MADGIQLGFQRVKGYHANSWGLCGFNPVIVALRCNSGALLGMSHGESLQRGDRPLKPTRAMNDYV